MTALAPAQDLFALGTLEELEAVLNDNLGDAREAIGAARRTIAAKEGEIEALETVLALVGHARAARDACRPRSE